MTDTHNPDFDPDADAELNAEAGLDAAPGDDLAHVDAIIAERDDWKDKALRAVAAAENTKRRAERETNDARAYAIQRFARDLLGVADNLQRALAAAPSDSEDAGVKGLVTGLEMTDKALLQAFESNGLTRVAPQAGDRFDPNVHQAMAEQPSSEVAGGCVLQTYQPGYVLFGRTIRPAMVVVAAKGSGPQAGYGANGTPDAGASVDTKA